MKLDISNIEKYDSTILKDAEHILSFIDEVTRKEETKKGAKPIMNWIHTFTTFEDVIDVLRTELKISTDISTKMAEQSIRNYLLYNISNITTEKKGVVYAYHLGYIDVRKKLIEYRKSSTFCSDGKIELTVEEVDRMSNFLLFFRLGINDLDTAIFENILSTGILLKYSRDKEIFEQSDFCRALSQMVREIKRLKQLEKDFLYETQEKMINMIRGYQLYLNKIWKFDYMDLAMLNSIYERFSNIEILTRYMINYIDTHNDNLQYPSLLNGLVPSERPSDENLQKLFSIKWL